MTERNLNLVTDREAFTLVVRAIILADGKLLAVHNRADDYYFPVGGAIHQNESSFDAVIRTVHEETGIDMEIDRFGFVHENFYSRNGVRFHEVGLYYYMREIPGLEEKLSSGHHTGELCFLPLTSLPETEVYPTFFKTRLLKQSGAIEHIFTWENSSPGSEDYE